MTVAEDLAAFAAGVSWDDLTPPVRDALRIRVLDAVGCALGSLDAEVPASVRSAVDGLGGRMACTLVGGGRNAPDRAALYNGALVRYLDFNDSYLAPGETCHPSDNLAAVLAAAEHAGASGQDLLVALALAYQVQCRLADGLPVRARGFDHVTHLACSASVGVARALGLDERRICHAVAIATTALNALRVTRTGALPSWKGLAAPFASTGAVVAAFLAAEGVTGPLAVFEGRNGFIEVMGGQTGIDWQAEHLDRVPRTILKRYNAEIHSQAAIEALLELRAEHVFTGDDVVHIDLEVFQVAYDIIGGGQAGDKRIVATKEQADHSLPYLLAVAACDGRVLPEQFAPARIVADDVQRLVARVSIRPAADLTARFPERHACRLRVELRDGRIVERAKEDYEGFHSRPMTWSQVVEKFRTLAGPHVPPGLAEELVDAVGRLETIPVADLTALLGRASARPAPSEPSPFRRADDGSSN